MPIHFCFAALNTEDKCQIEGCPNTDFFSRPTLFWIIIHNRYSSIIAISSKVVECVVFPVNCIQVDVYPVVDIDIAASYVYNLPVAKDIKILQNNKPNTYSNVTLLPRASCEF